MRPYLLPVKGLVILCLSFSFTLETLALPTPGISVNGGRGSGTPGGNEGASGGVQNESERFTFCESLVEKRWGEFAGADYFTLISGIATPDSEFVRELSELGGPSTIASGAEDAPATAISEEKASQIALYLDSIAACDAASKTLTRENYTDNLDEFEREGGPGTSGSSNAAISAGAMQCLGQQGPQQQQCMQQQAMQQQQGGGGGEEINCKHYGPETHDYLACKRIINFLNGFMIGKVGMNIQQNFRSQSSILDAQSELARQARTEEGVSITDTMGAQRDSLEQQGNMMYEQAAFDAAKAGVLMSMISSFPKPSKMIESCQGSYSMRGGRQSLESLAQTIANKIATSGDNPPGADRADDIKNAILNKSTIYSSQSPDSTACEMAVSSNYGETKLFENQGMIDTVRGIAIQAGLEALANGAKGKLLHDQANMVEDAMKDIEEFEAPDFPIAEVPEELASECLVNPDAEGCIAPNTAGFEGFRNGSFNANIGGSANLGTNNRPAGLDDDDLASSAGASKRGLIPNEFGAVETTGVSDNSFEGKASAGSIKAGQAAAGGGGGAPGGGAAGGGGGGGSGGGQANAGKKKPSGTNNIKIGTTGNGLAAVGGRGAIGAKKSKAANPFAKLLGKDKGKGNGTLQFRGPAQVGGKGGSLFEMISNRYSVVQKKDRLLKYKAKD